MIHLISRLLGRLGKPREAPAETVLKPDDALISAIDAYLEYRFGHIIDALDDLWVENQKLRELLDEVETDWRNCIDPTDSEKP